MRFCGKTIAISLLLAASASTAGYADSVVGTGPVEPTLMVLPGSDGEAAVSLETVSSVSAITVDEKALSMDASVEAGYPVLSFLFGRVPVPTPKPSISERSVAEPVGLVRSGASVTKPRQSAGASLKPSNVAVNLGKRRIPSPMPPIIGVYR